jgi:hypothetical protein
MFGDQSYCWTICCILNKKIRQKNGMKYAIKKDPMNFISRAYEKSNNDILGPAFEWTNM